MNPIVRAESISVSYGDVGVLQNVSLAVEEGSFIGILGPNGCGKTTFLRSISRILEPDSGTVYLDGTDAASYETKALARTLGCVRQETDVAFPFTVREIVLMGRHPHIGRLAPLSAEDLQIASDAMKTTNTAHLADRLITEVSGGERQRVLIARTLAQQPKILLLDEPTSHLDINHQIEILRMIRGLTPKITVIGVFHDLNIASYFCDRLILMDSGHILAAGTPAEVLTTERIRSVFQVAMLVSTHPLTGKPYLIPEYGIRQKPGAVRVHVISGGGSGTDLMYTLALHGYSVSAGVLSANDTDAAAARALGLETVIEPPFSPVSEAAAETVRGMIAAASAVVIAGMPVGDGNLLNLTILEGSPTPVYLLGECEEYAGGKAREVCERLWKQGAVRVTDSFDLLNRLRVC